MFKTLVRRPFNRFAAGAIGALVMSIGAVAGAGAATTPLAAVGGGWVGSPTVVHAAQLKLVVPTVRCAATKSATVTVGLFGTTTTGTRTAPWQLTVVASCQHGTTTYRGVAGDISGRSSLLRVHAGDRVRLLLTGALSYEIDNYTTGEAAGSGSAVAGGALPRLGTAVLFGARVSGHVSRRVAVHILRTRINRHALNTLPRHRQPLVLAGHRVVSSSTLGRDGSFSLTVAAT